MRARLFMAFLIFTSLQCPQALRAISPVLNPAPQDTSPLGNRTPLILVHGLQMRSDPDAYHHVWDEFLAFYQSSPELMASVKPYYFAYETVAPYVAGNPDSVEEVGLALGTKIEALFQGRRVILVAHSLGGLVSRSFMQLYRYADRSYGGSHVDRLITLGTPHHGVPLSILQKLGDDEDVHRPFLWNAGWDSVDGNFIWLCNFWLRNLNYRTPGGTYPSIGNCAEPGRLGASGYFDKIVVYGGTVDLSTVGGYWVPYLGLIALGYSSNDGLIPSSSALFNGWPVAIRRTSSSCDHSALARYDCWLNASSPPYRVFDALEKDILDVVAPTNPPSISAVSPDWLPAMPLPQRQTLTIRGERFASPSTLRLFDGVTTFERAATYVSSTELRYDIAVGPDAASWTVQVTGTTGTSNAFPFRVFANVDSTPPPSPLTPRSIPSDWFNSTWFGIDWTNPDDPSGITRLHVSPGVPPSGPQSGFSLDLPLFKPYVDQSGEGLSTYYIWLEDGTGNHNYGSAVPVTIRHDFTPPSLSITNPTSAPSTTVSVGSVVLGGAASDSLSGIASIGWNNDRGGSGSASLNGSSWSTSPVALASGDNVLTVLATDRAGNVAAASLTVTYQETAGSIRVTITPQAAAAAGAQWRLATEASWQSSGAIRSGLPLGTYQIEYKPITGWQTPSGQSLTISPATPDIWIDSAAYEQNGISFAPASLSFFAVPGSSPAAQSLSIGNPLGESFQWNVASNWPWLGVSPATGTNQGTVAVTANAAGLAVGVHTAEITISDQAGVRPSQRVPVVLSVFASGKIDFSWRGVAPMPILHAGTASAVYSGKIHVIGGGPFRDHYRYDPIQNTWETMARLPSPGIAEGGAAVVGSKIYAVNDTAGPVLIYDPAANAWTTGAMPPSSWRGPSVIGLGGKLYVIGGTDLNLDGVGRNEVYDPATNQWFTLAPMPTPRGFASAVALEGRIYVIGGRDDRVSPSILDTVEVYDPATNTWSSRASMPTARLNAGAVVINERIYVLGGFDGHEYRDTVEEFTPALETWRSLSPLRTRRAELAVGVVASRIYVIGGSNKGGRLSSTDEGSPTSLSNASPIAAADADRTNSGIPVTLLVLQNDHDPDGDRLRIESVAVPQNGSVTISASRQSIRYTPAAGFVGTEPFDYVISDGYGGTGIARVTIAIVEPTGSLRVVLQPGTAVSQGAHWRLVPQGTWTASGETVFGVPFGTHEIEFLPLPGWTAPARLQIEILPQNPDIEFTAASYGLAGHDFYTLIPCRVLDTRLPAEGPALASTEVREIQVAGRCGIPTSATAISFNITAFGPSGLGNIVLFPDPAHAPNTSSINFHAGQNLANNVIAPLAANGALAARAFVAGAGTVHLILDVNGYFK